MSASFLGWIIFFLGWTWSICVDLEGIVYFGDALAWGGERKLGGRHQSWWFLISSHWHWLNWVPRCRTCVLHKSPLCPNPWLPDILVLSLSQLFLLNTWRIFGSVTELHDSMGMWGNPQAILGPLHLDILASQGFLLFTKPWANAPKGLGSARLYLSLVAASEVGVWRWPQDPVIWMRAFAQFLLACLLSLLCTRNSQMWSGQRDRRQPLLRDPLKHPALLLLFSSLLADSYLVLSYLRGRKNL